MTGTIDQIIQWLFQQDRDKEYEINEHKRKQSLNANAYCWVLITKIASKIRKSKEDVYMQMLKDYGTEDIISVKDNVDIGNYVKYYEPIGESKINDKSFIHYRVYKGSSQYNTEEMSILIDGVVQEAMQLDIETMTPREIVELKGRWGYGNTK